MFIKCEPTSAAPAPAAAHHVSESCVPLPPLQRRSDSTAFRFTFYCQCAHMVSSLCSRLYCHYHHHVAINTPSHPIPYQPTHPNTSYATPFPSLMLHYVLHPSITAHVSNIVEPFGGRVESAKLFWDADGQGYPHTPNILAHLYIYLPVCVSVCLLRVLGKSLDSRRY